MKGIESNSSNLSTLVLAVLEEESMHGYSIAKRIRQQSEEAFQCGEGTLYPALRTLVKEGWIEGNWDTTGSGPAKKVYTLTSTGLDELRRRRVAWAEYSRKFHFILHGGVHESI